MAEVVRYTFTVYCDTPIVSDEDGSGPEIDRLTAVRHLHKLLNTHCDFNSIDYELMTTETVEE